MLVTAAALDALRVGFRLDFNTGLAGHAPLWNRVATLVPSTTAANTYGWLRDFPRLREWLGDRVVKSISEGDYTIRNRSFEATVGVNRDNIEDDALGIYGPMMQELGRSAAEFPDELVFALLQAGFVTACWDGQNFFDAEHPVGRGVVSNVQAGVGEPWFLMQTNRPLKPLIYQERQKPRFTSLNKDDDEPVFRRKEFQYGVDLRANAGFGFWQLAFGSKAALTAANYEAAHKALTSQCNDEGRPINVRPNLIVVGSGNRAAAKQLFDAMLTGGGNSNIYYKDVEVLEAPWIV